MAELIDKQKAVHLTPPPVVGVRAQENFNATLTQHLHTSHFPCL